MKSMCIPLHSQEGAKKHIVPLVIPFEAVISYLMDHVQSAPDLTIKQFSYMATQDLILDT